MMKLAVVHLSVEMYALQANIISAVVAMLLAQLKCVGLGTEHMGPDAQLSELWMDQFRSHRHLPSNSSLPLTATNVSIVAVAPRVNGRRSMGNPSGDRSLSRRSRERLRLLLLRFERTDHVTTQTRDLASDLCNVGEFN